ncbi:MAG: MFS transporter [Rikenellaceae bacterium]|nr:MFS transporter [Rikenellaceae bacterium]
MEPTILYRRRNKDARLWYRISAGAFYFLIGLVFSSWASRIPDIKTALDMNEAQLGGVLFFIPVGQMAAMAISGYLVSKFGSRRMLVLAAVLYPLALVLIGVVRSIAELSAVLVFFGMAANLANIAVNTQAIGVERLYGRSIMASFHGLWSLAGFIGGLLSTLMVGLKLSPLSHFTIVCCFSFIVILLMTPSLMPRDGYRRPKREAEPRGRIFTRPDRLVILLGVISFLGMVCEGTMFDWSSVYFEEVIAPKATLVRLGYIASMCSMAAGRFTADRFITRFGSSAVVRVSGLIIALGLLMATLLPNLWTATGGFLLVGLGVSSIVPICYSLAGRSKGILPGVAIAMVSTIGFLGFLLGPPVIGFVAHGTNLRFALGIILAFGLFIVVLSPLVKKFTK